MGAVLHTLNLRLFPEQLAYVINHAEDQVIICDASIAGLLARVRDQIPTVRHIVVVGEGDTSALGETLDYEALLAAEEPGYDWPRLDERQAAAMCYTSGTTGNPKGVVYSHRSTFLHTMAITAGSSLGIGERDSVLSIVPMFHANAWGTPYAGVLTGADLIMPQQFLQAAPLAAIIERFRPTVSAGVPTIWSDLLRYTQTTPVDMSSLRMITAGGAAVPRQLIERFRDELGVEMVQGWGMTETSPLCSLATPPRQAGPDEEIEWRAKTGRIVPGVEVRVCADDGTVLPNDGESVGEFEVRGPWITGSYYGDPSPGPVPRRLAADRRHRVARRPGLHADQRPHQGRDQVRRRVDLLGGARERGHGPPPRGRGGRHRRPRRPLERAAAGGRGAGGGGGHLAGRPPRVPRPPGLQVVAARALGHHRGGAQDECGQVRQEGAPGPHAEGDLEVIEVDITSGG